MTALTLPTLVKDDWLSKASGAASIPVAASMKFDPEPPVAVTLPVESVPSAPTGKATTEFVWSLLRKYMALAPPEPGGLGHFQCCDGAADAVRPNEARRRRRRARESIFWLIFCVLRSRTLVKEAEED